MKALLSLELKKLIFNKKNIFCAIVLLVVALIFVGTYDANNEKALKNDITNTQHLNASSKIQMQSRILAYKMGGYIVELKQAQKDYEEMLKTNDELLNALKKDDGITKRKIEAPGPFYMRGGYCVDDSQIIYNVDVYNYKLKTYPTVYERLNGRIFYDEVCKTYIPFLFIIFLIFLASESFSEEFHAGTNKLIYTQPVSITKIYLAKFISVIICAITTFVLIFGSIFLYLGLTRGFGNFDTQYVIDARALTTFFKLKYFQTVGVINEKTLILYSIPLYLLLMVLTVLFTFFISSLSKNSIVSVIVPTFIFVVGYFIYKIFIDIDNLPQAYQMQHKVLPDFMYLLPFPYKNVNSALTNLNPSEYNPQKYRIPEYSLMTYPTELTVLFSYVVLFFTLSFTIVRKRSKC